MTMKKLMISVLLIGSVSLSAVAQDDDMYFVPTKANKAKEAHSYGLPSNTYYSGSSRSVDEYNRQIRSTVTPIDSAGNDIIDFSAVRGVYPDSTYREQTEDYKYTRRLSRFDGYTPSEIYWEGYRDGQWDSPWYYSSWYGWYDYDPWYWGSPWYHPWYRPWHYVYYRPWHYRRYWPGWRGGYIVSRPIRRTTYSSGRSFGGRSTYSSGRAFGSRSSSYSSSRSSSFGGSRGSSFGGSRGSSFGGSRGGGFGGGRSASGGRSFGGRR